MPSLLPFLLLLATLPGLLVPAGFGLARCECSGALRLVSEGAPPACRSHRTASDTDGHDCCRRQPRGGSGEDPAGESVRGCGERGCECDETLVPTTPPRLGPPGASIDAPAAVLLSPPPTGAVPGAVVRLVGPLDARAPPAPGRQRNLPLLL